MWKTAVTHGPWQDNICHDITDDVMIFFLSQVIATDEESGEAAHASVDIEVLQKGIPGKFLLRLIFYLISVKFMLPNHS